MNSFYDETELSEIGFKSIGKNVLISKKVSIYSPEKIAIGNNVRIDDFCILSGKITLGKYIHISAFSALYGGDDGIIVEDFCTISSRVALYSINDDYSGNYLTNPMVDEKYRNVKSVSIIMKKHSIIGTNSTVLPGVTLNEGVAIGANTLVNKDCEEWKIYIGTPARILKDRSRELLNLEKDMLS